MRRLMLLIAAGSLWLFLAAVPVFADGGPHVASVNNGTAGVNADSCAGCHRAHTAQGEYLLVASSATASVPDLSRLDRPRRDDRRRERRAVRARDRSRPRRPGARVPPRRRLRQRPYRVRRSRSHGYDRGGGAISQHAKVPVRTAGSQPITSAHLPNTGGVVDWRGWPCLGQRPRQHDTRTRARTVDVECATCHNPHGNGKYRILNPIPDPAEATIADSFVPATVGANVTDAAAPPAGDTRNYTIIQTNGGTGTLLASQVAALNLPATAGDYWRRRVPWNSTTGTSNDAPNGLSSSFYSAVLRLVPDVPLALPEQGLGRQGRQTRSSPIGTLRNRLPGTAPRAMWRMGPMPR